MRAAARAATAPAAVPSAATAPAKPLDVRYGKRLDPQPLSAEQIAFVTAAARAECPAGRDVWFAHVLYNKPHEGKPMYSVTVYYTPDVDSPRLRTGRYLHVNSAFDVSPEARRRLGARLGMPDVGLPRYAIMSPARRPFGSEFGVPAGALLPFSPPDGISAADLVGIVDAARAVLDADARPTSPEEPVCRIETEGLAPGELQVFFGTQEGPLSGGGTFVTVRKQGSRYVADQAVGHWRS